MSKTTLFTSTVLGWTILALLVFSTPSDAAPGAKAIEFWQSSDEDSEVRVSHAEWQSLLDAHLKADQADGVNRFDYKSVSKADKQKLEQYLLSLQNVDPRTLRRTEQLAYWINFYNALTVDVVLNSYPVESIKNIRSLTSLFGPWDKNLVKVAGQELSLNNIEHGILRPIWQDPRIHFAVNCASIGCPNLMPTVFTAENADDLMEQAANDFINHPRGADVQGDVLTLSSIFDWYSTDFGENESEVIDFIGEYRDQRDSIDLNGLKKILYDYDWNLNETK